MISLDTNVLVRILVGDNTAHTKKAMALVKRLDAKGQTAHVADIVVCELVCVLQACYDFSRPQIADALRRLTAARQLAFQRPDQVLRSIHAYENGRGDFADYMIRESARQAGVDLVATFDKKLHKEDMFTTP